MSMQMCQGAPEGAPDASVFSSFCQVALMADYSELQREHWALQRLSRQPGFPRVLHFGQQDVPDDLTGAASPPAGSSREGTVPSPAGKERVAREGKAAPHSSPLISLSGAGPKGASEGEVPQSSPHAVLVMEVLGPSLERLLNETTLGTGGLSPAAVLTLAIQVRGGRSSGDGTPRASAE